jgi:serine/threonine-protein kinase
MNPESRARLLREARACGRIVHRNVVEIYDVGQTEAGDPFLVMQLLSGETISQVLRRGRKFSQREAAGIAVQIARGLGAAHASGIVHRDLKPGNIFLHREPDIEARVVKLLDFGVSKFLVQDDESRTATGRTIGSPAYMSPEQVRGARSLDPRSDLWALGAVLFEMLTGRRLFAGDTAYGVASEVLGGKLPSLANALPDLDPRLLSLISRCLMRDPAKRISSAAEVVESLASMVIEERLPLPIAQGARPEPPITRLAGTQRRARRSQGPGCAWHPDRARAGARRDCR